MREQEYRAKEKKMNCMTRDGLVEENLVTGNRESISKQERDADFRKPDADISYRKQSIRADLDRDKPRKHRNKVVTDKAADTREDTGTEARQNVNDTPVTESNTNWVSDRHTEPSFEGSVVQGSYNRPGSQNYQKEKVKKSLYKRKHYCKQNIRRSKLQFDKEETVTTTESVYNGTNAGQSAATATGASGNEPSRKLQLLEDRANKANSKLKQARKRQPKKRSLRMQRVYSEEKQKGGKKLYFEETPKEPKKEGIVKRTTEKAAISAGNFTHGKVSQVEKENSGVEAAHKSEQAGEAALRSARSHKYNMQRKQQSRINRLEHKAYRRNTSYQYQKYLEEHPEMKKKVLNKFIQKQRVKREYQKAYKAGKNGGKTAKYTAEITTKIAHKLQELLTKNKTVIAAGVAIGVLLIFIMAGFSSCSMMFADTVGTTFFSCWLSKPAEIDQAELELTSKEIELQNTVDSVESDYPGYDEYRYNVGSIGHNPFELINYLSAKYIDFTFVEVSAEVNSLFDEMYDFSTMELVEIRTRTETHTWQDPITGEAYEEEVEVEYEYYILEVTLVSKPLSTIVATRMNTEEAELYAAYQDSKGGLQQLGTPLNLYWYSYISSYYGYRKNPTTGVTQFHRGVDIALPEGTEVLAGHTGTVTTATYHSEYGNYVVIEDSKGYTSKYAHLSSLNVSAGQSVTIGDKIGETGNTGSSTGSHLHIEVLYGGEYYNPLFYFNVGTGTLYGEAPGGDVTPPESYDDATVAALIREAEKYLGMPYTFGGTPPTSFDCSAFVCWAFTNSGVHNLPRTTAQGIYDQCTPVLASEAKAGDIIFFTGTYNAGSAVTHVGIYCGNGIMIHCGDPIQYASINTSYWQSHFYGFGRLN